MSQHPLAQAPAGPNLSILGVRVARTQHSCMPSTDPNVVASVANSLDSDAGVGDFRKE